MSDKKQPSRLSIADIVTWGMFVSGLLATGFVFGTASAYFDWPIFKTISDGFSGGDAWLEEKRDGIEEMDKGRAYICVI